MRGWWIVMLLLVATATAGQDCRVEPGGVVECTDSDNDSGGNDDLDIFLSLVALTITIGGAIIAYFVVRKKRRTVGQYLRKVEATYREARNDPGQGLPKLVGIRGEVRSHYTQGRLEDAPFLELEKRITQYIGRLRIEEIDGNVELPKTLRTHAEKLLQDGVVSAMDVQSMADRAASSRLAAGKRERLIALFEHWATEDAHLVG